MASASTTAPAAATHEAVHVDEDGEAKHAKSKDPGFEAQLALAKQVRGAGWGAEARGAVWTGVERRGAQRGVGWTGEGRRCEAWRGGKGRG